MLEILNYSKFHHPTMMMQWRRTGGGRSGGGGGFFPADTDASWSAEPSPRSRLELEPHPMPQSLSPSNLSGKAVGGEEEQQHTHTLQRPPGASPAPWPVVPTSSPRTSFHLWDRTPIGTSHLIRPDAAPSSIRFTHNALNALRLLTRQELADQVRPKGAFTECYLLGRLCTTQDGQQARPSGASPGKTAAVGSALSIVAEHVAPCRCVSMFDALLLPFVTTNRPSV